MIRIDRCCLLLLLLLGCSRREPSGEKNAAADGTPRRGGTVVVGVGSEPETLIPYANVTGRTSDVASFLFMNLVETQADLVSFAPSLATSWTWSPDHLQLTMQLRTDVVWADGVPVTADDVQFSFEVGRDSLVGWRSRHWKAAIRSCDVVDRHTVRFVFDHVFPEQFRYAKEGMIIPRHLLSGIPRQQWAKADYGRAPLGCGAFRLERWDAQQRLVLARNERWFEPGKPYLDRIVFEFVTDANSRATKLRTGELDLVDEMAPGNAASLRAAQDEPTVPARVLVVRGRTYDYLGYNLRDARFADRRVREALTRSVDRGVLVERACHGFAERFEGPIVPLFSAYDSTGALTAYDPEGARRLLQEAGWRDGDGDGWVDRDGQRLEFDVIVASDVQRRMDAMVLIQNDWKQVGVKANITPLERTATIDRMRAGKFTVCCAGWGVGLSINLQGIWGCGKQPSNYIGYCNPSFDSLNARALTLSPPDARPLWVQAQRLVRQDYPYTWLYYVHDTIGIAKRLHGAEIDPRGTFSNPEDWWVDDVAASSH